MTIESNIQRKIDNIKNNPLDFSLNPNNLYLWGFLWSDGYIMRRPARITLEILDEDFKDIKNIIPNYYNRYSRSRKGRKKQSSAFSSREDLVDFLYDNGYDNKQKPSKLLTNNDLSYYWFRGVVDGDGCWYYNDKWKTRQFVLASNYEQDWDFFTDMLDDIKCKYKIKHKTQKQKTQKYSIVRICEKSSIKNLINYLYPEGYDIGLRRKYEKSQKLIQ